MSRDITTLSVLELIALKNELINSLPIVTCEDVGKARTERQQEVQKAVERIDNRLMELSKRNRSAIKKALQKKQWEKVQNST